MVLIGVPTGIRTPVVAVKGRCPRPLDDGDFEGRDDRPRAAWGLLPANNPKFGGARRDRTVDLNTASVALSQLSYGPESIESGNFIEPPWTCPAFFPRT